MGMDAYLIEKVNDDTNEEIGYWRKNEDVHYWFTHNTPAVEISIGYCKHRVTIEALKRFLLFILDNKNNFCKNDRWMISETITIIAKALTCEHKVYYVSYW